MAMAKATAKTKIMLELDGIERAALLLIIDDIVLKDREIIPHRLGIDGEGAKNMLQHLEGISDALNMPSEVQ